MISLIKRNSCGKALDIARMARDMLGGKLVLELILNHHLASCKQDIVTRKTCSVKPVTPGGGLPYKTDGDARRLA